MQQSGNARRPALLIKLHQAVMQSRFGRPAKVSGQRLARRESPNFNSFMPPLRCAAMHRPPSVPRGREWQRPTLVDRR
jgi:hypothetical protein